jgi:hypothetical protein
MDEQMSECEMRKRIIDVLDKWHDGSRERKADDIVAALTLPPVPGVDREVVARLENDLAQGWISNARTAADLRAILALVSPLKEKGEDSFDD